jgi:hypothetical protein
VLIEVIAGIKLDMNLWGDLQRLIQVCFEKH